MSDLSYKLHDEWIRLSDVVTDARWSLDNAELDLLKLDVFEQVNPELIGGEYCRDLRLGAYQNLERKHHELAEAKAQLAELTVERNKALKKVWRQAFEEDAKQVVA